MKKYLFPYKQSNTYFKFFKKENIDLIFVSCFAFLIPIIFAKLATFPSQIIIGTAVNFLLAYVALNYDIKKAGPIILLPSFGMLISGIIFGALSIYLIYLIPVIWVGNYLYVYLIQYIKLGYKKSYFISLFAGSLAKSGLLTAITLLFVFSGFVPQIMLLSMSLMQLVTALSGGLFAGIYYLIR